MAERLGTVVRRIGMRNRVLALAIVLPVVLAGCGDGGVRTAPAPPPSASVSASACTASGPEQPVARADLDGDGTKEVIGLLAADACLETPVLTSGVDDLPVTAPLASDLTVGAGDVHVVQFPGRTGEVLLVTAQHPRGGFQANLFGYADGKLEALTIEGEPVFPFVATDVMTDPISARCTADGFEVLHARRHEPIGVVPAWDVDRTAYTVDGNTVTKGATTEVADNVLEANLQRRYRDLLAHRFFENCRAGQ
jgi:hypothetical protein